MLEKPCPCGSEKKYAACCHLYISGAALAPDPEALMRSRYTAFCVADIPYLRKTWHADSVPEGLEEEDHSNWVGLEIIEADEEDDEGEVEFKAKLIYDDKLETLHERSFFVKEDGAWLYHSGEFLNDGTHVTKITKSQPCPCGSGKVFKNCHYIK